MRLLPAGLAAILGLQLLALVFFFADAGEELASAALSLHPVSELAVALAPAFGTVFIARPCSKASPRRPSSARRLPWRRASSAASWKRTSPAGA